MATKTSRIPIHTDIPRIVYDNLRAVHESRVRRQLHADDRNDFDVPHLSNVEIFRLMPDNQYLMWDEHVQPTLTETTLARMFDTVEFPKEDHAMPQGGRT